MSPEPRSRRWFLKTGLAISALGLATGGGLWWRRGIIGTRLTQDGLAVLRGVARGVLAEVLPSDPVAREQALNAHAERLALTMANLPAKLRHDLALLLGALANLPTRLLITHMVSDWPSASEQQIQLALESLRLADSTTRESIYHGLRDMITLTYFGTPQTWGITGYPGPQDV